MKYDVIIRIERNNDDCKVNLRSNKDISAKEYADILEILLNCFEKEIKNE